MDQMIKLQGCLVAKEKLRDPEWQEIMAKMAVSHERAFCMCSSRAPELYVTRRGALLFLARIPGTGQVHHPACPSFDIEDADNVTTEGRTIVSPGFPLWQSTSNKRVASAPSTGNEPALSQNEPVVDLVDLLQRLWRKAEFNRWQPRMQGRRNWNVIRRHILEASATFSLGSTALEECLFLPPFFERAKATEHQTESTKQLDTICSHHGDKAKLGLVMGVAKSFGQSKYGHSVQLLHLPEITFYLRPTVTSRLRAKNIFAMTALASGLRDCHVLTMLLVEKTAQGYFNVVDAGFMRTTNEYVPVWSVFEEDVIARLVAEQRSFLRPLPVSSAQKQGPVLYLTDAGASVVAIHINPDMADYSEFNEHQWLWCPTLHRLSQTKPLPPIVPRETIQ